MRTFISAESSFRNSTTPFRASAMLLSNQSTDFVRRDQRFDLSVREEAHRSEDSCKGLELVDAGGRRVELVEVYNTVLYILENLLVGDQVDAAIAHSLLFGLVSADKANSLGFPNSMRKHTRTSYIKLRSLRVDTKSDAQVDRLGKGPI